MHSQFNLWKATIAVVIYVALCMLVLCFSPPDDAATLFLRCGTVDPQTEQPPPS